ncbi:MAG TPA: hypothetical protein VF133_00575 [Terriglobales bacterium]
MLGLALSKLTDKEWWIEIPPDDPPDARLLRIDQNPGGNIIQQYNIEIVDWERNVDDIMTVIGKKCERAYSNYLLLVNARSGKLLNFNRVINEMKTLRSPFLEVWIVAFIRPGDIKVVRVAPAQPFVDLTRADFLQARKQRGFAKRGTRSTSSEFEDRGLVFMPIPRGD